MLWQKVRRVAMAKRKEEFTVIKSNVLLENRVKFKLGELKLTLAVIAQIKREDEEFQDYRLHIQDFQELTNVDGDIYAYAKNVCIGLRSKTIVIPMGKGKNLVTGYFSDIEIHDRGVLVFSISPKMRPYLLQLKKSFTVYDIRNVLNCRSVYSIRLYQILKQYEKIGKRTMQLDELKYILGFDEGQYSRWGNFKTRIIEVARKELKKHSDLFFEYEVEKKRRVVQAITFTIKKQRQKNLFNQKPEPSLADAIPAASYHKSADAALKKLEEDGREAVPIPAELKNRF
jgi:plasmid replication initiation protein